MQFVINYRSKHTFKYPCSSLEGHYITDTEIDKIKDVRAYAFYRHVEEFNHANDCNILSVFIGDEMKEIRIDQMDCDVRFYNGIANVFYIGSLNDYSVNKYNYPFD